MKNNKLKSSVLAGLCTLLMVFPKGKYRDLTDVTQPYLGEYECKQILFDGHDYLDKFDYIYIELKKDDEFFLTYKEKAGKKRTLSGIYEYDKEEQSLVFKTGLYGEFHRKFPLQNGGLSIMLSFGEKSLLLKFQQK
jgi:hypothetical protein